MIDKFKKWLNKGKEERKAKLEDGINKARELIKEAKDLLAYSLDRRMFEVKHLDYYNGGKSFTISLVARRNEVNINPFKDDILSYIEFVDAKYGIDWEDSEIMCDFISRDNPDNFKKIPLKEVYNYKGRFQAISIAILLNI